MYYKPYENITEKVLCKIKLCTAESFKSAPTGPDRSWIIKHSRLLDGILHIIFYYCSYTWAAQLIR